MESQKRDLDCLRSIWKGKDQISYKGRIMGTLHVSAFWVSFALHESITFYSHQRNLSKISQALLSTPSSLAQGSH